MRSLARLTLALLLALTGALAACGDDGGSGTDVGLEDRDGEAGDDAADDDEDPVDEDPDDEDPDDEDPDDEDPDDTEEPTAGEAPFVDALAETFTTDETTPMSDEQARCTATRIVRVIGLERLDDAGLTPESFAGDDTELTGLGLSTDEGLEIIDAFDACGFDFYEEIIAGFTADSADPEAARACMEAVATPDEFREFMARGFVEPGFEDSAEADAFFEEFFGCTFGGLGDIDG